MTNQDVQLAHFVHCFTCEQNYQDLNEQPPVCCGACGSVLIRVLHARLCPICKVAPAISLITPCKGCDEAEI